ncbi:Trichothecene C-3 esterase [Colletotrichum shisoi]|uniref:Trichothecene C-3 esterase n=1 Tax=Colletotrichum shisoi TaxID=2078593 RepID=A0A5Q4BC03_9PEZI|nr:Trichothecene C-3 esterase [Colletotrichum shisoi]
MRPFIILSAALLGAVNALDPICDAECQKGCDEACQAAIQTTYEAESALWVGDIVSDPFYSTPANFTGAKPGDILRWEDVPAEQLSSNWTIPTGLSLSRVLYVTEDVNRKPIPASAWVLLPFHNRFAKPGGDAEQNRLRTVVWTHGTAGRSRLCAPTNNKGLYYDWKAPFILAESGYAVIAPDYAGQGSDIPQGFMYESGWLHVADVAYSLVAARKAIGGLLGRKWVVYGHSEGGMTAWRTNERLAQPGQEALLAAGEFLGSVAAAPALRPQKLIPASLARAQGQPARDPFSVYFLQSLAALFPDQIKVADYLGEIPLQRLGALDKSCFQSGFAIVGGFTPEQLYKNTSWLTLPVTDDWAVRYNGQGPHSVKAPMLVISGEDDAITPNDLTLDDFNKTCAAFPGSPIRARVYPDMGHGQVLEAARADIAAWIDARFEGVPVPEGCVKEDVETITKRYATRDIFWHGSVVPF